MDYISTRNQYKTLKFDEIFLSGLATDGGLYVPQNYPEFSTAEIQSLQNHNYQELALKIIQPFIGDAIESTKLQEIINQTYNENFNHNPNNKENIAPIVNLDKDLYILELFHGPTAAFKDFALQLVGRIMQYLLKKKNQQAIILGATSGDTGSAAIYGCKNSDNSDIFILHPHNKVSDIQRKQMTSVTDKNVYNIAIDGNFDDCQNIVKYIFCNQEFIANKKRLIAVNSINWARIMGQIIYYFHSAITLKRLNKPLSFVVPTGNFGDIFAGFVAKKMGLPIDKLIISTNKNDILARFINNNSYNKETLMASLSPSMDIQISSNFERLLFNAHNNDSDITKQLMQNFNSAGKLSVNSDIYQKITNEFLASSCSDQETSQIMQKIAQENNMIIDPHTATAVKSAYDFKKQVNSPMVILSTAHAGKFPKALEAANLTLNENHPKLTNLLDKEERFVKLANSAQAVIDYISQKSL
jgi:threonine synthase